MLSIQADTFSMPSTQEEAEEEGELLELSAYGDDIDLKTSSVDVRLRRDQGQVSGLYK